MVLPLVPCVLQTYTAALLLCVPSESEFRCPREAVCDASETYGNANGVGESFCAIIVMRLYAGKENRIAKVTYFSPLSIVVSWSLSTEQELYFIQAQEQDGRSLSTQGLPA